MINSQRCFNRYFVHPDIELNFLSSNNFEHKLHRGDDFIASVQHWKNILAEKYKVGPGSRIGIAISYLDLRYVSMIFAVFELGAVILILDTVPIGSKQQPRCRVLAPWDLYLYCSNEAPVINLGLQYSKIISNTDDWFDYQSIAGHKFADQIEYNEQALVMQAPSSGSTGVPKVIDYPSFWLYMIGEHCAEIFDYKSTDKILHLSNLHHGGSSGTFFLPTMKHCRQHFFVNAVHGVDNAEVLHQQIIQCIIQNHITRVMFPNSLLLDKILKALPPLQHECHFYTLQANHRSWIREVRRTNLAGLHSLFGASEMLGPIFLNTIDCDSDADHDVLNYGKPLKSFYQVQITDDGLHVRDVTGRSMVLNDRFVKDQHGNYFFEDRSDLIRVNEIVFTRHQIQQILNESGLNPARCFLACDSTTNKIYLLIDETLRDLPDTHAGITAINASFAKINANCGINYIDYKPIDSFISGIKISRELILSHFREKHQLI